MANEMRRQGKLGHDDAPVGTAEELAAVKTKLSALEVKLLGFEDALTIIRRHVIDNANKVEEIPGLRAHVGRATAKTDVHGKWMDEAGKRIADLENQVHILRRLLDEKNKREAIVDPVAPVDAAFSEDCAWIRYRLSDVIMTGKKIGDTGACLDFSRPGDAGLSSFTGPRCWIERSPRDKTLVVVIHRDRGDPFVKFVIPDSDDEKVLMWADMDELSVAKGAP
jgi:hypothetical protein